MPGLPAPFLPAPFLFALALGLAPAALPARAPAGPAMAPTATIAANIAAAGDHATLVAALKTAGLADTLAGPGPYTLFAPTDAAFARLPAGTVDTLTAPAGRARLTEILTYHVVPGRLTAKDIARAIRTGGGKATLTTMEGDPLTATLMGRTIMLTDAKGGMAHITQGDITQANGVLHVLDGVLMP